MKFEYLIKNKGIYCIFVLSLSILSFFCSAYIKCDCYFILNILILLLSFSVFFLTIFYEKFFQNRDKYFLNKYIKFLKIIGFLALIFLPFLIGLHVNFDTKLPVESNVFYLKVLLIFALTIVYNDNILNRLMMDYKESKSRLIFMIGSLILLPLAVHYMDILLIVLESIIFYFSDFLSISLSILVFCATLSLLAFTYCMVIEDKNKKEEMLKNGEDFFVATIFSIFSLILLFLISYMQTFNVTAINSLFSINLIFGFIFLVLICSMLYILLITLNYLINGIYSSLKVLNFKVKSFKFL
ncbi:hypothetical protein [Methanobrevibacter woesei]|uniref:hypothetical protein n=1 Tax=Methanobrevibacter woesei TaxID=190976 RepID=UPI0026DF1A92|nr:hypothetical protein [Methanobrevibacter woesei]